jgi:hypothetical protein
VDEVRKRLCSLAAYVKDIKQGSPGKPTPESLVPQ